MDVCIIEERRLDLRISNEERANSAKKTTEILFKLNNTLPFSDEYDLLLKKLFTGGVGENCYKMCIRDSYSTKHAT